MSNRKSSLAWELSQKVNLSDFSDAEIESCSTFGFYQFAPEARHEFDNLRQWLSTTIDGRGRHNAVFMDATTIHSATEVLSPEGGAYGTTETHNWVVLPRGLPLAFQIWDLATLVNAVILYDRVFYFRNRDIDPRGLNMLLDNQQIFLPIDIDVVPHGLRKNLRQYLAGIWSGSASYLGELHAKERAVQRQQGRAGLLTQTWGEILDESTRRLSLYDPECYSEDFQSDVTVVDQLNKSMHIYHGDASLARPLGEMNRVVVHCNLRGFYNFSVAHLLRLPYYPNVLRLPVQRFLYREARLIAPYLQSLATIQKYYEDYFEMYKLPNRPNLVLPFFLAGLLARIDRLDQFHEALTDLRREAASFRRHKAELDRACDEENFAEIEKLRRALVEDAQQLRSRSSIAPVLAIRTIAFSLIGTLLTTSAALILKLLSVATTFADDKAIGLAKQAFRPRYWFLSKVSSQAIELMNAAHKIEHLWQGKLNRELFTDRLARLSRVAYFD